MLYTNPEGKQVEVYPILAIEERDSMTIQLVIDCAVRQNKMIISREAHKAHKPMVKDYLAIDPATGILNIIPRGQTALLGTPVTEKPVMVTPPLAPSEPVVSSVAALPEPATVPAPVAIDSLVVSSLTTESPAEVVAPISLDLPEEVVPKKFAVSPMNLSRLATPVIPLPVTNDDNNQ